MPVPVHRRAAPLLGAALVLVLGASCAGVSFRRTAPEGGTFRSTATTFTVLSYDFPGTARSVARGNASDAGLPNLIVEHESVFPYLGWFDFLLDIVGVRRATVSGTWGTFPDAATGAGATSRSSPGSSSPLAASR